MTLWVRARGAYRAEIDLGPWRPKDFFVRNLVKSLKGETFNGYSEFTLSGKAYQITAKHPAPAYLLISN